VERVGASSRARSLLDRLGTTGIRGCSRTNLRRFRDFYQAYADTRYMVSVKSGQPSGIQHLPCLESLALHLIGAAPNATKLAEHFVRGWSHYVTLLAVDADAHRFHEIVSPKQIGSDRAKTAFRSVIGCHSIVRGNANRHGEAKMDRA